MSTQGLHQLSDEDLIKAHLSEATTDAAKNSLRTTPAGRVMLEVDADRRAGLAAKGIALWIESKSLDAGKVASALLRANQKEWTTARLVKVVEAAAMLTRTSEQFGRFGWFPYKPLITTIEMAVQREGLSPAFRTALEQWKEAIMPRELTPQEEREFGEVERISTQDVLVVGWPILSKAFATIERLQRIRVPLTEERKLIERLARVLDSYQKPKSGERLTVRIDASDAVGIGIAADVGKGGRAAGPAWAELLQHARTLNSTVPSQNGWSRPRASSKESRRSAFSNAFPIGSMT